MRLAVRGVQATPTIKSSAVLAQAKKERKPRTLRGPPELNLTVDMMAPVRHADSPVSMDASPDDGAGSAARGRESNPCTARNTDNGSALIDGQDVEPTQQEIGDTEWRPMKTISKPQTSQLPSVPTQMVHGIPQSPTTTDPLPWSPGNTNPGQQLPSNTNPFPNIYHNIEDKVNMNDTGLSFADAAAARTA